MYKFLIATYLLFLSIASLHAQDASTTVLSFDKELTNYTYPYPVYEYTLRSQNQNLIMRYMDIGDRQSEKVVVLLHGKNFSGYYWQQVAKDLAKLNYRVIIPDQIGFGKSSKPNHYQYSFTQLALNTQSLLQPLNINKYSVVGHSMGGMLAITMTYLYEAEIEKLVLINPIGLETYLDHVQYKDTDFFYKRELDKTIDKARNYQRKNYYDGKWSDEYEALLTPLKGWLNGPDWQQIAWNNALTYNPIFTEDTLSKLSKVTVPSYFIIGTRDKTGPGRGWKKEGTKYQLGQYETLGKDAAKQAKNSTLLELKGLGHMPHIENYSKFSKVFYPIFKM